MFYTSNFNTFSFQNNTFKTNAVQEHKTVALIGAGRRGREVYARFLKEACQNTEIVAVAEPNWYRRKAAAKEHEIPHSHQFASYQDFFKQGKLADGLMITTMDHQHYEPTIQGIKMGYDIFLEKPVTPTFEQFKDLVRLAKQHQSRILIAHVLRYTPFYQRLKLLLQEGKIGALRSIDHIENVGYFHFVHSYVRGNWRNTSRSAPLFLAKSSHDFDLFSWLLDKNCLEIFAQGKQTYFLPENMPHHAGQKCLQCKIESECPFSAKHIYLDQELPWPKEIIEGMPPRYQRYLGVCFTNLGRCVYRMDNDMPEVLTASLKYGDNILVNFTLTGLSREMTRRTKIFGTHGEIEADFEQEKIKLFPYRYPAKEIPVPKEKGGHGGGDLGLIKHWENFLQGKTRKDASTLEASIESHLTAYAAERSRQKGQKVNVEEMRKQLIEACSQK